MATRWATTSTASAIHATLWRGFRAMARTSLDIKADAVRDPNGRAYNRTALAPGRLSRNAPL